VSTAELKRDILVFAKTDPREFLNILNDPELKYQAKIRMFFENKLLVLRNNDKEIWFNTGTNKKKMMSIGEKQKSSYNSFHKIYLGVPTRTRTEK
jgi:hypothetical protein